MGTGTSHRGFESHPVRQVTWESYPLVDFDLELLTSFVNEQIAFHAHMAKQADEAGETRRFNRHQTIIGRYGQLIEVLEDYAQKSRKPKQRLALTWEEVHDLPPELVQELSVSEGDKLEFDLLKILDDFGGVASLDRFLVELYQRSGEIYARTWLNNRLYRMVQKEMIYSVPGRKGVYSAESMDKEEADALL